MTKQAINLRCSGCAFDNPDGAQHCGMCGEKLALQAKKKKSDPAYYKSAVVEGTLVEAAGYGNEVWNREMMPLIGLSILTLLSAIVPYAMTVFMKRAAGGFIIWILIDFFFLAFIWGGAIRIYLDCVRGRKAEIARAITGGFQNIFKSAFVLALLFVILGLSVGFAMLVAVPMNFLDQNILGDGGLISGTFFNVFIALWSISIVVILILPLFILLTAVPTIALCRAIDGRESLWGSLVWTARRVTLYWKDIFRIGMGQLLIQILGFIICYIGVLATIPLSGFVFASVYEWMRLHGEDSDEY